MSAMESLVATLLKASGVNPDEVKETIVARVKQFEDNVKTLNDTLISIQATQARIEAKVDALMEFHNLSVAQSLWSPEQIKAALERQASNV